jgi:signal transduction histidine kinase
MAVSRQHAAASADPSRSRLYPGEMNLTRPLRDRSGGRLAALEQLAHRLCRCADRAAIARAAIDVCVDTLRPDGAALSAVGPAVALELLEARGDAPLRADAAARARLDDWRPRADAVVARVAAWLESPGELEARDPGLPARGAPSQGAWAAVPLVVNERAVGLLELSFRTPRRFDPRERAYLAAIADACARALDAVRLREHLERVFARLTAAQELTVALGAAATPGEVADALSHAALAATGATTASVSWRQDDGGLALVQSGSGGCRHLEAGRVASEARLPITAAEASGAPVWGERSAAVPLVMDGVAVGVFGLDYPAPTAFDAEERAFLIALATQSAHALRRAMLFEAEAGSRRRAEAAERLATATVARLTLADDLAAALAEARSEPEVARVAFERLAVLFGVSAGVVTTRTADDELEVAQVFGAPDDAPRGSTRLESGGPHAKVFETREPLWLIGGADGRAASPDLASALAPRRAGWLAVPLCLDGVLSGTLSVTLASPVDDEARTPLLRVVEQCGRALSRARLAESERAARRAAEAAELETRRLGKLQEEFVAVVGHDLRTPLSAIQLTVKTLFAGQTPTDVQARKVGRVFNSVDRITEILHTLRDFTQARLAGGIPLAPERVDAGRLVQRAVSEMEAAHPARAFEVSLDGDLVISADGGRLLQVLANLLGNAVQHGSPDRPVTIGVRGEGAAIVIDVHNEGPPIPPALLPTLFEPFRQGDASRARAGSTGSMGLGLFIVHEVVHAHGGMVSVDSRAERGTTFSAVIPRFPTQSAAAGRHEAGRNGVRG